MKLFIAISLSLFLVACGQAVVQEPVTPPAVTTPVPEMMAPVEETPVYEDREPVVDEEPAMEEPVEEEPVEEEPVEEEPVEEETTQSTVYNAQTLANYDGLQGRLAYIALDGVVYDVTGHPMWPNGLHRGLFQAGKDYSAQIPASHRRDMRYDELPKVGTYE